MKTRKYLANEEPDPRHAITSREYHLPCASCGFPAAKHEPLGLPPGGYVRRLRGRCKLSGCTKFVRPIIHEEHET